MMNKLAREIIFRSVVIMFIVISILLFFFLTGGQIDGINYNPEMVFPSTDESNVNGLSWEVIDEDVEAIDDGVEIIPVELWYFSPRSIFVWIITKPMAYIPPLILTFALNYLSGSRFVFVCSLSSKGSENRTCS